ncbi:hypothetical protein B0H13DRAFT_1882266 [Mycena leptocephala]|nr:hypothetical protein B0H13DRAFT_1882266 [Mycena leptocephala]
MDGFRSFNIAHMWLHRIEEKVAKEWLMSVRITESTVLLWIAMPHLQTSSIILFAWHGIQDTKKTLRNTQIISDERLTVAQMMKQMPDSDGGAGEKLTDEAMLLRVPATLLYAQLRSVCPPVRICQLVTVALGGQEQVKKFFVDSIHGAVCERQEFRIVAILRHDSPTATQFNEHKDDEMTYTTVWDEFFPHVRT